MDSYNCAYFERELVPTTVVLVQQVKQRTDRINQTAGSNRAQKNKENQRKKRRNAARQRRQHRTTTPASSSSSSPCPMKA